MYTVTVTFIDENDDFGFVFKDYDFNDLIEARRFYIDTVFNNIGNKNVDITANF